MAEDIAMQNYVMNTLREGGSNLSGGGGMGHSNGYLAPIPGFLDKQTNLSFEQQQQVFTFPDILSYTLGKMLQGLQGYASVFSLSVLGPGQSVSPGSMVSLFKGGKVPSMFSSKGG